MSAIIKTYYRLTKPGIIYGNALMFAAGFFLASRNGINWLLLAEVLLGLSLIIGSACVLNNIADREIDTKMERTKKRAIATGVVSPQAALMYSLILFVAGFSLLFYFSTVLSLAVALLGFIVYVFIYTPMKPRTGYALFVGAVAGATPPVVGYTAVTGTFDVWALVLFIALFIWQIPHFLAIAHYRFEEYQAAGIPLFIKSAPRNDKERKRSKQIFFASLVILLATCLAIALWRLLF